MPQQSGDRAVVVEVASEPARGEASGAEGSVAPADAPVEEAVRIRVAGGSIVIGDAANPLASPAFAMDVQAFDLDRDEVSVGRFAEFVAATGHRTTAEELGSASVFVAREADWRAVEGATWLHPDGDPERRAYNNHPVTQVALADAVAFCAWAGGRLPTEFEWEFAARNAGSTGPGRYPWGNEPVVEGRFRANLWQGWFPNRNTMEDGYFQTSPIGAFDATPLGFHDLAGNVWEWTSSPYATYPLGLLGNYANTADRTIRGLSFLCDPAANHGASVTARQFMPVDSPMSDLGFRCAYGVSPADGSGR